MVKKKKKRIKKKSKNLKLKLKTKKVEKKIFPSQKGSSSEEKIEIKKNSLLSNE